MPDVAIPTAAELEDALEAALADGTGPGAAAAVVKRDGAMGMAAAGLADAGTGRAMSPDTPSRIGSISKTLTAATVLRLRDRGALSLDDLLVRHLPEVRGFGDPFGAAASVTLRDVLYHLAGLPGEAPASNPRLWSPVPIEAVLARPGDVSWAIAPRSSFKYSNLGYELLGEVVARIAGVPYASSVSSEVFRPLGMHATRMDPDPETAAAGHDPAAWPAGDRQRADQAPDGGASGGWWSTVGDLARWMAVQLEPERAPAGWAATIREAHRPVVVTDPGLGAGYGLGWRVVQRAGHLHVAHGGLTTGFEARLELDPERGVGVAVLLNGIGPREPAVRLGSTLLRLAGDEATPPAPPAGHESVATAPIAVPADDDPRALPGAYREAGFETLVTIEATPHGLWLRTDGDTGGPLAPTADPERFGIGHGRSMGESLLVLRAPDGAIDGINVAGYPMVRLRGSDTR